MVVGAPDTPIVNPFNLTDLNVAMVAVALAELASPLVPAADLELSVCLVEVTGALVVLDVVRAPVVPVEALAYLVRVVAAAACAVLARGLVGRAAKLRGAAN